MPLPINLGTISQVPIELDFIRRLPPQTVGFGSPSVDFGEQLREYQADPFSGNLNDMKGKRRWSTTVFPFRMLYTSLAGYQYLQQNYGDLWQRIPRFGYNANPTTPGLGWGFASVFNNTASPDGSWALDIAGDAFWADLVWGSGGVNFGAYAHYWLYSVAVDNVIGISGMGPVQVQLMQFLATNPINYEIWSVTIRDPVNIQGDYTSEQGYFPPTYPPIRSETPWGSSSDFTKVSSGSLKTGQVFTIPIHDLAPRQNCQSPPAGSDHTRIVPVPANDAYWAGWGVANYLVFV